MMNKLFDKINMACVLRGLGLFLILLYVIQAFVNAGRGSGVDDMALIFLVTIANGIFQPFVLLGLAEIINRQGNKA